METSEEGSPYQDPRGLVTPLILLDLLLGLTPGTGTVANILLRGHTLHMLGTRGSTGQMVDLLALMDMSVGCHPPIMDMVHQLTGGAQLDLAPKGWDEFQFENP